MKSPSTKQGKMWTKPSHYIQGMFASTRSTQIAGCPRSNRALSTMKWQSRPLNSTMMKSLMTQRLLSKALQAQVEPPPKHRLLLKVSRCHPRLKISPQPTHRIRRMATGPSGLDPSGQIWWSQRMNHSHLLIIRLGYGYPFRMKLMSTGSQCLC